MLIAVPLVLFAVASLGLVAVRRWYLHRSCDYWQKVSGTTFASLALSAASFIAQVVGTTILHGALFAVGVGQVGVVVLGNWWTGRRIVRHERAAGRFDDAVCRTTRSTWRCCAF